MDISLVIPAHNEEGHLAESLNRYIAFLCRCFGDLFEIIVVANGCQDQTAGVAKNIALRFDQVRVIDIPQPIGKGGAVLEGFRQAAGNAVLFADADGATSPASLITLYEKLGEVDVAIGSRWLPSSHILNKQPFRRRVFSRAFNLSVRLLFDLPFVDTQCGAKAFRQNAAKMLAEVVKETGWAFDVDLLLWARMFQFKIAEVAVEWADQPGSTLHFGSAFREVAASLWKMKWTRPQPLWIHNPGSRRHGMYR